MVSTVRPNAIGEAAYDAGNDWMAKAAAISAPAAYWVLASLAESGAVDFSYLDEHLEGPRDWIAVGQLMRAG